jgi:hypothetical protein
MGVIKRVLWRQDASVPGQLVQSLVTDPDAYGLVVNVATAAEFNALVATDFYDGTLVYRHDTMSVYLVRAGVIIPIPTAPWIGLGLLAPWVNYNAGFAPAAYRKIGDQVQVRGLITGGTTQQIAALPPGYRPILQALMSTMSSTGGCRVDAGSNGALTVSTNAAWVSLDGVLFSTI